MNQTITSDFIKKLTELFASHLISLIYTKVPHALYIDRPNFGSELIQDSEYFRQMARELILDHLAEPAAHTVISISVKAQKLAFYTQDQWERHPFFDCSNITYLHYQFETHLVTLAIRWIIPTIPVISIASYLPYYRQHPACQIGVQPYFRYSISDLDWAYPCD